jgi:hypothetical protein
VADVEIEKFGAPGPEGGLRGIGGNHLLVGIPEGPALERAGGHRVILEREGNRIVLLGHDDGIDKDGAGDRAGAPHLGEGDGDAAHGVADEERAVETEAADKGGEVVAVVGPIVGAFGAGGISVPALIDGVAMKAVGFRASP